MQCTGIRLGKGFENAGWVVGACGEDDAGVGLAEVECCETET